MARLLGSWEDNSPEWHEARRWRIGGSDIGCLTTDSTQKGLPA